MSALRRHILGFFAACVAVAVGVALGAGPLQGAASADGHGSGTDTSALRDQVAALKAGQLLGESVLHGSSGQLLGSSLAGGSVTVVVLPGVSDAVVSGVGDAVARAGGQVGITARVSPKLVDPAQKTYTASVAAGATKGLKDLPKTQSDQPYAEIAALVTRAYAGRGTDLVLDDEAVKIDSELEGSRLVTVDGQPHRRGSLVVVLAPGDHGSDDVTTASHVIEVQLVSSLATGADAVLVATPPTGSEAGGLIAAAHKDVSLRHARLSTLNVVDGTAAQVCAVYALSAAAHGTTGAFGVFGSTVKLPPGLSSTHG
jgi:Copper transport outer membrane protein, MctB